MYLHVIHSGDLGTQLEVKQSLRISADLYCVKGFSD